MRICILHNSGPGGAARLVNELAERLASTDDVEICTWASTPPLPPPMVLARWCPAPAWRLPLSLHPFSDLARSFIGSARAATDVDHAAFDAVLVLACQWSQAPEALVRLRTPNLYFAQETRRRTAEPGYLPTLGRSGWSRPFWLVGRRAYDAIGRRLDRRALLAARQVVTNSNASAQCILHEYGRSVEVVELGVATERFTPRSDGTARDGRIALLVGALDPTKGACLAVEALALVDRNRRPALHLIANRGDSAFGQKILRQGEACGVHVTIHRNLDDEQLIAAYQSGTMLLALATNEPFGLTVLEASACGLPTVAIAEGGYLTTVEDGTNGRLVAADPASLSLAIDRILAGDDAFDFEQMVAWTQNRWSWERCVADIRRRLYALAAEAPGMKPQ